MCIAIPYEVVEVNENCRAQIDVAGSRREISTLLVPETKVGDYVLVYLGAATARIEEHEALEVMRLFEEMVDAAAL